MYKSFFACGLQERGAKLNLDPQVESSHNGLFSVPERNQTSSHVLSACSLASLHWWGFPGGSDGKASVSMRETQVRSLGREDPLEKEMAIHFSTIAWRIPWTEEPGRLQSMGSQRAGHD